MRFGEREGEKKEWRDGRKEERERERDQKILMVIVHETLC